MAKKVSFREDVRPELKKGVDILADAVRVTMGAKGGSVIIGHDFGYPQVTKDGVTVAKMISLPDPVQNVGAQMIISVANKTAEDAGDGTTTATVLAQAMIEKGMKNVASGASPVSLKSGINRAVAKVVEELKRVSIDVKDNDQIKQIATISANNDEEVGALIAEAMGKISEDGVITVEESKGTDTYVEVVEGLQFEKGYLSPYFVTDQEKMLVEMQNVLVFITTDKITSIEHLLPMLEMVAKSKRPILIISNEVTGEALQTLVLNKVKNGFEVSAVSSPSFGDKRLDYLEDIASITGGTVVSEQKGVTIENFTFDMFGECERVSISKDKTTIVKGLGKKDIIEKRVNQLKKLIKDSKTKEEEKELKTRLNKLSGGVAVLYVGANTEPELGEKKDRVDDALSATRSAVEEGIVIGGGLALLKAREVLLGMESVDTDEETGVMIVYDALRAPIMQILANANKGLEVLYKINEMGGNFGYDVKKGEYVDMMEGGIIDPTKVTRVALENAASVASLLLTTECVITEIKE